MRKLTVTEPDAETLELSFAVNDGKGAVQLKEPLKRRQKTNQRLQRLSIAPCAAADLKVSNLFGHVVQRLMDLYARHDVVEVPYAGITVNTCSTCTQSTPLFAMQD